MAINLDDFQVSITPCGRVGIILPREAAEHLMCMMLKGIPWGIVGETPKVRDFSVTAMELFARMAEAGVHESVIRPVNDHTQDIWTEGY